MHIISSTPITGISFIYIWPSTTKETIFTKITKCKRRHTKHVNFNFYRIIGFDYVITKLQTHLIFRQQTIAKIAIANSNAITNNTLNNAKTCSDFFHTCILLDHLIQVQNRNQGHQTAFLYWKHCTTLRMWEVRRLDERNF